MRKILILILLIALYSSGFAQGVLRGRVVSENQEALIGANIVLSENGQGEVTDKSGKFRFTLPAKGQYHAVISFIGYETQTSPVEIRNNETTTLDIKLKAGNIQLADVVVSSSEDRPVNTLSQIDIKFRPINTAQDVLRMVPGLFIAQHAGGGKAEQIFLRGFDADHGTDVNIEVDGMPVNMVSHAHGQGYADLHFLIPELISYVDFDKGPYFANKGDLTTAGYVAFQTKNKLERDFVKVEGGSFGMARLVSGINIPMKSKRTNAYVASEIFRTDGYFVNCQKFTRFNLQAKINSQVSSRAHLTAAFTAFDSHWDASGQIPERAVAEGLISRYGSIDPSEGGGTSRFNSYVKLIHDFADGSSLENQAYAIKYDFNLFSNFTFYLKDPVNGDQINQKEGRWVYGYKSRYLRTSQLFGKNLKTEVGGGLRDDVINNIALDHTVKRVFLAHIQYGDIREANANAYLSETLLVTEKLSLNAAVRVDAFHFSYNNKLTEAQEPAVNKSIVSPKLNMNYQVFQNLSLFLRSGTGFHSNDARVVVEQGGIQTLPRAYGIDIGADMKITPELLVHTALWRLDLAQEFVYQGDDGIVEPSGKTKREGVDLSVRYQFIEWLFADIDLNATKPRFKGVPEGQNFVPLAPTFTSIGGLSIRRGNGLNGSLRYRYMADRPANDTNTLVAKGYFIADAILNYSQPGYEIGLTVENFLNRQWKEAQFETLSKLKNEPAPIDEINFTPGTPFSAKIRFIRYF
jgi:outer membrane receptor protein involved in Fe transport